jgi:hypothetical protein
MRRRADPWNFHGSDGQSARSALTGDLGCTFFWLLFFVQAKKSDAPPARCITPAGETCTQKFAQTKKARTKSNSHTPYSNNQIKKTNDRAAESPAAH